MAVCAGASSASGGPQQRQPPQLPCRCPASPSEWGLSPVGQPRSIAPAMPTPAPRRVPSACPASWRAGGPVRGSGLCSPGATVRRSALSVPFSVGMARPPHAQLWSVPEGVRGILDLSWEEEVSGSRFPGSFTPIQSSTNRRAPPQKCRKSLQHQAQWLPPEWGEQ